MGVPPVLIGLAAAIAIAVVAWRLGALTPGGAAAAVLVGTVAVGANWTWGVLLVAYFMVSSLLTRFRATEKSTRTEGRLEKTGARDAQQVLANGGVFMCAALGYWISGGELWQALGAGALAASAADTWATELGTLAKSEPRSILGFHPVPVGTSGGLTLLGLLGTLAGAGFVAGVAWALKWPTFALVSAITGGALGSLLDSLIGAGLQARRHCPKCDAMTERVVHGCGTTTDVVGGIDWLDNDGVNLIATLCGALVGAAAATFA